MNSYFLATGYNRVLGDVDFPAEMRKTSPWGVCDHLMFDQLRQNIDRQPKDKPWFKTLLTLSSHEPWTVPYKRLDDPMLNAFAYLDESLGKFMEGLRRSPEWKNTLVIILPDHGVSCRPTSTSSTSANTTSPLVWTGGAVRNAREVARLCNQTDLAATLLGQLGIDHARSNSRATSCHKPTPILSPSTLGLRDTPSSIRPERAFTNLPPTALLGLRPTRRANAYTR